jgi:uncharacterized protein
VLNVSFEFILIGFIVGALIGITGVGGASILTPILIFLGIQPAMAIGTDFFYNFVTKGAAMFQHIKQKTVNCEIVKYVAFGSIPAATVTNILFYSFLVHMFDESVVLPILGFVLIGTSILTLAQMFSKKQTNSWKEKPIEDKRKALILIGVTIGIVVGLTSVGAGSLFAIIILYLFNLRSSELVGSDITHAFLLAFVTTLLMASYGKIDYELAINLLLGSIPGTVIGSKLTLKLPSNLIRIIILIIILLSGLKLIL